MGLRNRQSSLRNSAKLDDICVTDVSQARYVTEGAKNEIFTLSIVHQVLDLMRTG